MSTKNQCVCCGFNSLIQSEEILFWEIHYCC